MVKKPLRADEVFAASADKTLHRQGYRDPIDGTLRPAVTACGTQIVPGMWVTDDPKKMDCEGCKKSGD